MRVDSVISARKGYGLDSTVILGGGVTGLCSGYERKRTIYEGLHLSGGLCATYYLDSHGKTDRKRSYRFEKGGGHWIFGNDEDLLGRVKSLSPVKKYSRRASVYFPDLDLYVPYPLQNHAHIFPKNIRKKIQEEMLEPLDKKVPVILKEWLIYNFGRTLCSLFFLPFHDLYTAGLTGRITIQDLFKSPSNRAIILQGLNGKTPPIGYNTTFVYPKQGLDHLMGKLAGQCDIRFNKKAVSIDRLKKKIFFNDGSHAAYGKLISTIPLNELVKLCTLKEFNVPDPHTSVLVFNIGAQRGAKCPKDHWVYVPGSQSGFHRLGFYSNVDTSFLPEVKQQKDLVSIYVEISFLPNDKPNAQRLVQLEKQIIEELKGWKYIKEAEVVSSTWINHAYTWNFPGSQWKDESMAYLKNHGIYSIGRYGAWKFQGILDSMKDGFLS